MTTRTAPAIHLHPAATGAWKDALLVAFIAVLLGGFVAQLVVLGR